MVFSFLLKYIQHYPVDHTLNLLNLNDYNSEQFHFIPVDNEYSLGQLQSSFESFKKEYLDYKNFIEISYHSKKINALKNQIKRLNLSYDQLNREKNLQEEELKLAEKQYERTNILFKRGIISEFEFEESKSNHLQKKSALERMNNNLLNVKFSIAQLEETIQELELQYAQEKNKMIVELKNAYENLRSQISQWIFNFVLIVLIGIVAVFNESEQDRTIDHLQDGCVPR